MFSSLLIANRGEIAVRIARSAKRMGLRTIAVHSDADRDAPHVRLADEAYRIGPAPAGESYLDIERVLAAARASGAEAVHPGYGFLSENADFAEACAAAGITFVGPPAAAIRAMGLKDEAKRIMEEAGVPVVPGYRGDNQGVEFLKRKAYEIGYPILVKAVAGGGGKGMRRVDKALGFEDALAAARREAKAAFGNERVLLERFVASPRHIEVQVFADSRDDVVHLGERDCSLQRRHQKVIEEAPAPGMSEALRMTMGQAACDAARAVGYRGAGTVEFIVDGSKGLTADGFYFMEMNTRLQVEHPVTEMVTGQDLVEWQLRIAAGEPLPLRQDQVRLTGHAMEARVYAEDPARDFLPSTGTLHLCRFPEGEGVRVDSGVTQGSIVSEHYDPMIAKVLAHAATREAALDRLDGALERTLIAGPRTNIAFLRALLANERFRDAAFDTQLIDRELDALVARAEPDANDLGAAAEAFVEADRAAANALAARFDPAADRSPWSLPDAFQIGPARDRRVEMMLDDERVDAEPVPASWRDVATSGGDVFVLRDGHQFRLSRVDPSSAIAADGPGGQAAVRAPMTGRVILVAVTPGAVVTRGQTLFTVEAMKMEHAVTAPRDGAILEVAVAVSDQVREGQVCVTFDGGET